MAQTAPVWVSIMVKAPSLVHGTYRPGVEGIITAAATISPATTIAVAMMYAWLFSMWDFL
jgi:hypothetical protein